MKKANYAGFIPWVLVGNIIGGMFIVPMMPKVINSLCYKNKYNNDAALYYKGYMNECYEIRVLMPKDASKIVFE